jgi:GT2 family glycosyltransferase
VSACRIGLAIPAWRSACLIGETLHSALSQSGVDVTVTIGVDGADPETVAACAPFLHDPRVQVIVRPARLGWVKNSAATLADTVAAGVDYAAILPHDDILEPGYCAALAATHRARPGAAVVYSDIVAFGDRRKVLRQESVCGPPVDRLELLLSKHFNAVAFRGLVPASVLSRVRPMDRNAVEDYGVDTVWMTRLACYGDLVRVPEPLYRKRFHPENAHAAWKKWPREFRVRAWLVHCRSMADEALEVASNMAEWDRLRSAACRRIRHLGYRLIGFSNAEQEEIAAAERAMLSLEPPLSKRLRWALGRRAPRLQAGPQ